MHIESIEPRRLMAAVQGDRSFGDDGVVDLPAGVTADIAVLGTRDAVYLSARESGRRYLYKFQTDGNIDRSWGDDGRVRVAIRPQVLSYDRRTGMLYAAGVYGRTSDTVNSVEVVRFAADGTPDVRFGGFADGTGGIARYTPTVAAGVNAFQEVTRVQPLPHGQVVVAFGSQISTTTGSGDDVEVEGGREISLLRFRDNGTRDPAFGRRGVRTYFGGAFGDDDSGDTQTARYDVPLLTDLQPLADGGFRLVATRQRGTQTFGPGRPESGDRTSEAFAEARNIDADGRVRPEFDYAWSLGRTTPADRDGDDPRELRPLLALNDGAGDVNAVAIRDKRSPVLYQLSTVPPKSVERPIALPTNASTDVPAYNVSVLTFRRGYFVVSGDRGVVKFKPDGVSADRAFADGGALRLDTPGSGDFYRLAADADGRLLAVTNNEIRRFARDG